VTAYDAGRRREYTTRDHLVANGYEVIRSAGSRSPIDLFAFKPGQLLLVQCKRDGRLGPAEWNALYTLAEMLGPTAVPILAVHHKREKLELWRLVGRKVPRAKRPPMVPFVVDELAEVT
jgi:Holliday junction resolvase